MRKYIAVIGASALMITLGATGSAVAGSLIGSARIKDNSIRSRDIHDGTIKLKDLRPSAVAALRAQTPTAAAGQAPGNPGLRDAYYAVAFYDVGDTNAGAVATVACNAQTDVAISGGVQVTGLNDPATSHNTPVSSSFPGRMDWSTNTPKPDRLDGWIVQFGGNAGSVSDAPPQKTKIWALCVPGVEIPVEQTYLQSAD
jgi:hypothetical protein